MQNLIINNLELAQGGKSAVLYQPDDFNEVALVEFKRKRTLITFLDDFDDTENLDSKVIRAFKDYNIPTFSLDNETLEPIITCSTTSFEDLIALLAYHQEISQETVDIMMDKILRLTMIYSSEFIINEIRKFSERYFEEFIETDDTVEWFRAHVF